MALLDILRFEEADIDTFCTNHGYTKYEFGVEYPLALSTSQKKEGNKSLYLNDTAGNNYFGITKTALNTRRLYSKFFMYIVTYPSNNAGSIAGFTTGTPQESPYLRVRTDGKWELLTGATVSRATSSNALSLNTWYEVAMEGYANDASTYCAITLNGETLSDTTSLTNNFIWSFKIMAENSGAPNGAFYFDYVRINDTEYPTSYTSNVNIETIATSSAAYAGIQYLPFTMPDVPNPYMLILSNRWYAIGDGTCSFGTTPIPSIKYVSRSLAANNSSIQAFGIAGFASQSGVITASWTSGDGYTRLASFALSNVNQSNPIDLANMIALDNHTIWAGNGEELTVSCSSDVANRIITNYSNPVYNGLASASNTTTIINQTGPDYIQPYPIITTKLFSGGQTIEKFWAGNSGWAEHTTLALPFNRVNPSEIVPNFIFTFSGETGSISTTILPGIVDNFNRADEKPLSGGGNWDTDNATSARIFLTGSHVEPDNFGTPAIWVSSSYATSSFHGAGFKFLNVPSRIATNQEFGGIVLRRNSLMWWERKEYFLVARYSGNTSNHELYCFRYNGDGNVWTTIGSSSISTINSGDEFFAATNNNGDIIGYINNTEVGRFNDKTIGWYDHGGYVAMQLGFPGFSSAYGRPTAVDFRTGLVQSSSVSIPPVFKFIGVNQIIFG